MSATATLRPTEITDRALENRYFQRHLTSRFFRLADRLWLAEIEDAAALLELEDRLY
ncbi:hypothetical protein [Petropleomorpha daqingensis]|uniref:Uncharacterized protein n=1 Tax=Petropleomorpha daqingensis TaxID=2026353 RepID=A0A853CCU4_9ACTN|nr:hypothetical protein [Petropleomorpha daqingensis]NYJ05700.1 hypothetical protein [Petropleomorpha daqingensis]